MTLFEHSAPVVATAARAGRTRYGLMAAAVLALIVYGSLVPGDFKYDLPEARPGAVARGILFWWSTPRWVVESRPDISSLVHDNAVNSLVLNLLLYLPAGVLLRLGQRERGQIRGRSALGQVVWAVGICTLISWMVECTQGLTASRTASYATVTWNTLGALAGALAAVPLRAAARALAFKLYTKIAHPLHHLRDVMNELRREPAVLFFLVAVNILPVCYWLIATVRPIARHHGGVGRWLPFAGYVRRSYDVAALQIGQSMIAYALVGSVVALALLSASLRRRAFLVIVVVVLLATLRQAMAGGAGAGIVDLTEPVIALLTAGVLFSTGFLLVHAVRTSCRRRQSVDVAVDRRRRPHRYAP